MVIGRYVSERHESVVEHKTQTGNIQEAVDCECEAKSEQDERSQGKNTPKPHHKMGIEFFLKGRFISDMLPHVDGKTSRVEWKQSEDRDQNSDGGSFHASIVCPCARGPLRVLNQVLSLMSESAAVLSLLRISE